MRLWPPIVALITIAGVVSDGVQAQDTRPSTSLSDEQVQRVLGLALENIARARCENMQPCTAATAEEKANPPITIAEARIIMHRGLLSAAAQHCGLDWQGRNYTPMMSYWRHKVNKSERQLTLISLIHGIVQGMGKPDARNACTARMRENLDRQLTFQP
jgi:hypothetical protein